MKSRLIIFSIFIIVYPTVIFAQGYTNQIYNELDDATYKKIVRRVTQDVNQFTSYLSLIVTKPHDVYNLERRKELTEKRKEWKKAALNLFLGKGEVYYSYVLDEFGNPIDTIRHNPVNMQVTSLRDKRPRNLLLKDYLTNLENQANKNNFIYVTIQTTKWQNMKVSQLRKLENGHYVGDVYFEQVYIRSNGDRLIYSDKTTKRVTCYIELIETDLGTEFIVRLGDIQATDTQEYEK